MEIFNLIVVAFRLGESIQELSKVSSPAVEAVDCIAQQVRYAQALGSVDFTSGESVEIFCASVEAHTRSDHDLPLVMFWEMYSDGRTILHLDLFYEVPNAPYSHCAGVKH